MTDGRKRRVSPKNLGPLWIDMEKKTKKILKTKERERERERKYLVIVVIGNGRRVSVLRPVRDRVSISSAGVAEKRRREGRLVWAPPGRAIDLDREATAPSRGGRAERFHETTKRQKNKTKQNKTKKERKTNQRKEKRPAPVMDSLAQIGHRRRPSGAALWKRHAPRPMMYGHHGIGASAIPWPCRARGGSPIAILGVDRYRTTVHFHHRYPTSLSLQPPCKKEKRKEKPVHESTIWNWNTSPDWNKRIGLRLAPIFDASSLQLPSSRWNMKIRTRL